MTLVQTLRRLGVYAAAALLVTAVSIKPVTVYAMGTDSPPPADDSKKKKKKKDNNVIEQQEQQLAQEKFLRDYRAARAMIVKVRALLDDAGKPVDWTQEIWSPTHNQRPGAGGNLLGALALPDPPPEPPPNDVPEANGGGATRNAEPLYNIPAKRILHHLVTEAPVRTSALRGLGAMPNVFALECCIDELAERAGQDPVAYRLSITADARARAVIEKVAAMAKWNASAPVGSGRGRGIAFARYKNRAAYSAVVVELSVDEDIRLLHVAPYRD